jgi:biotin transport system substrate-specific component
MNQAVTIAAQPTQRRTLVDQVILILAGTGAVALSAKISVPTDLVPLTAQTLAVLLVGALLGPTAGTMSILTYLAAGTACPVLFAHPLGLGLVGPTGGYLIGFAPAACLTGALIAHGWGRSQILTLAALLAGLAVIFACGVPWLMIYTHSVRGPLWRGLILCLPGEALKITLAGLVIRRRWH